MANGGLRSIHRYGRFTLLVVFVVLLGGRYSLDRLGDFPAFDLRWVGLVLIGFLCLAWATIAREETTPTRIGPLAWWFVAWAGWLAVSAIWAPPGARTTQVMRDIALLVLLTCAGWAVASRLHPRALSSLWWWLYVAGALYFLGALAGGPDVQGRYSAFGGGPNVFVRVMALAILAALFLATTRHIHWVLVGLPFFLYGAYMSGSRGGLLALAVVVVIGGWPLLRRMGQRMVVGIGLALLPVVALTPFFYNPAWFRFLQERYVQQTFVEGYDSGRTDILEQALHIFVEHLFFGAGLDGYYALQGNATSFEYPHNVVMASAAEGGLVGVGLLLGALVTGGVALGRLRALSPDTLGFALSALFMLVASMFSGDYYDSRFLWLFLGLAVIAARRTMAGGGTDELGPRPGDAKVVGSQAQFAAHGGATAACRP